LPWNRRPFEYVLEKGNKYCSNHRRKIAVEGCAHGDLDKIYDAIAYAEQLNGFKVDLLICCGDFEVRSAN